MREDVQGAEKTEKFLSDPQLAPSRLKARKGPRRASSSSSRFALGEPEPDVRREVDRIIGKPFEYGASGPDAFSCHGLLIYLLNRCRAAGLVDPYAPDVNPFVSVERFYARFELRPQNEIVRPLDALFFQPDPKREPHIVVVVDDEWGVQSTRTDGFVHRLPLFRFRRHAHRTYRLKELER